MKNLTALLKNSISTCFLLFLSIVSYGQFFQNFTRVKQTDGLVMQRLHEGENYTPGVGLINFHSDTLPAIAQKFDYMYMRATPDDRENNLIITNDGTVMIGGNDDCIHLRDMRDSVYTKSSDIKLYVNGEIASNSGSATITILSDQRFKKNITPLENSLDVIRQSNFVEFQYNDLSGVNSDKKYYGILAQEMQEVLPSTITKGAKRQNPTDKKADEFLMFNPNDLIYSGLNAIKELDEENQVLKDKVAELEAEVEKNNRLEQRVNELEKILTQLIGKDGEHERQTTNRITTTNPASLSQNRPNPIYNSTDIEYHLPNEVSTAQIVIQDMNGNKITEFNLQGTGTGKITFSPKQIGITSSTYVYSLLIDGVIIESKKMIFIK